MGRERVADVRILRPPLPPGTAAEIQTPNMSTLNEYQDRLAAALERLAELKEGL